MFPALRYSLGFLSSRPSSPFASLMALSLESWRSSLASPSSATSTGDTCPSFGRDDVRTLIHDSALLEQVDMESTLGEQQPFALRGVEIDAVRFR